jgi:hypothetical protein
MIQDLVRKVKRRETPLADLAYRAAKKLRTFEMPAPRVIFLPIWYAHHAVLNAFRWVSRCFYYQPMFRARCEKVGKNLRVDLGAPYVYGAIKIRIGDDCTMSAISSFVSTSVGKDPVLEIGNKTYLGYRLSISVGSKVTIGSHVLIAGGASRGSSRTRSAPSPSATTSGSATAARSCPGSPSARAPWWAPAPS